MRGTTETISTRTQSLNLHANAYMNRLRIDAFFHLLRSGFGFFRVSIIVCCFYVSMLFQLFFRWLSTLLRPALDLGFKIHRPNAMHAIKQPNLWINAATAGILSHLLHASHCESRGTAVRPSGALQNTLVRISRSIRFALWHNFLQFLKTLPFFQNFPRSIRINWKKCVTTENFNAILTRILMWATVF